jgi:hypothetical protein
MVRQHFKRKELTMNKIFFGIHTSLLLLLCALLACCSQDEEEYASTEKLVPLDISAVIDGMGTRADATEEKTAFVDGDEITITIDGDESGTEYKYKYSVDGENKKWVASDSEKQIMVKESADPITIKATYGSVDLSGLNSPLSLDALANSLAATASVSYDTRDVKLEFTHTACKLVINVYYYDGTTPGNAYIFASNNEGILVSEKSIAASSTINAYVPLTATEAIVKVDNKDFVFMLSGLAAGKTYACNICTNLLELKYDRELYKLNISMYDVYLEDGTFARVINGDDIDTSKVSALKSYAKSKGTTIWGVVAYIEPSRVVYVGALNDYVIEDASGLFTVSELGNIDIGDAYFTREINNNTKLQNVIKAFGGSLLVTNEYPYYWYEGDIYSSTSGKGKMYYDAAENTTKYIYENEDGYSTFKARVRQIKKVRFVD